MMNLSPTLGIYVHIPFCQAKCSYCGFVSQVGNEKMQQEYVAALCREITAAGGDFSAFSVDSLFFGGGTPTVLSTDALALILQTIRGNFRLSDDAEISMKKQNKAFFQISGAGHEGILSAVAKVLFTTESGKRILLAAKDLPPNSPKMANLLMHAQKLAAVGGANAAKD